MYIVFNPKLILSTTGIYQKCLKILVVLDFRQEGYQRHWSVEFNYVVIITLNYSTTTCNLNFLSKLRHAGHSQDIGNGHLWLYWLEALRHARCAPATVS